MVTVIDNRGENFSHLVKRNEIIWESLSTVARRGQTGYHTGARVARGYSSAPYDYDEDTQENVKKLIADYRRMMRAGEIIDGVIILNNYMTELWVADK